MNIDEYMCSGSMDPKIVLQAFKRLLPVWQSKDLTESNRLEDARVNLGTLSSLDTHVQTIRSLWPVNKTGAELLTGDYDYSLPLCSVGHSLFLPFLRSVEQLMIDERLSPILVYWSRQTAARFLPSGQRFRELMRDAFCLSIFSEDREDPPDEWCFLVESRGLCLILYGQQNYNHSGRSDHSSYSAGGAADIKLFSDGGDDDFAEQNEHFPPFEPGSEDKER